MTRLIIAFFLVGGLLIHRILDGIEQDSDAARVANHLLFIALCTSVGFLFGSILSEVLL